MRLPASPTFGLSCAFVLGACAGPLTEVTATASPTADFQAFKTYAFVPADRLDMAGSQMMDPVTRRNLEAAIGRELERRGLSPAAGGASPSLLVSYFADVYEGLNPYPGSSGVRQAERQGKLTIDLIDTASQQAVWHGEAWARDPDFRRAEQVIADLLRKYPQPR